MGEVRPRSRRDPGGRAGRSGRAPSRGRWLAANADLNRIDAELLAAHVLEVNRARIIAFPEIGMTRPQLVRLDRLAERLRDHEPLACVLGHKEFFGMDFLVGEGVLVPRPETELLVELALDLAPRNGRVADLGTGSGCIAVALKTGRPDLSIVATDISAAALEFASANAAAHGADVSIVTGDWFEPMDGRFDCVVANPPYIADDDPALAALRREPRLALTAGADGLDALRRIIQLAPPRMTRHGCLLLEHGFDQAGAVRALLAAQEFCDVETRRDLAGLERATLGFASN